VADHQDVQDNDARHERLKFRADVQMPARPSDRFHPSLQRRIERREGNIDHAKIAWIDEDGFSFRFGRLRIITICSTIQHVG
jgi:hypothetical protein